MISMEKPVRILVINNEIEARLLSEILTERKIPHMLKSYHDSAYDGLWQTPTCWGELDAMEKDRDEILKIYQEILQHDNKSDN